MIARLTYRVEVASLEDAQTLLAAGRDALGVVVSEGIAMEEAQWRLLGFSRSEGQAFDVTVDAAHELDAVAAAGSGDRVVISSERVDPVFGVESNSTSVPDPESSSS